MANAPSESPWAATPGAPQPSDRWRHQAVVGTHPVKRRVNQPIYDA